MGNACAGWHMGGVWELRSSHIRASIGSHEAWDIAWLSLIGQGLMLGGSVMFAIIIFSHMIVIKTEHIKSPTLSRCWVGLAYNICSVERLSFGTCKTNPHLLLSLDCIWREAIVVIIGGCRGFWRRVISNCQRIGIRTAIGYPLYRLVLNFIGICCRVQVFIFTQ